MTSKEYIVKALTGKTNKNYHSSIAAYRLQSDVTVYSYGLHYPLVKIIDGNAYINDRGYSVTTAKHIAWAFSAAAQVVGWANCYHAPLVDGGGLDKLSIARNARIEFDRLQREMDGKKRKDTRVYEWLKVQQDRMSATMEAIA